MLCPDQSSRELQGIGRAQFVDAQRATCRHTNFFERLYFPCRRQQDVKLFEYVTRNGRVKLSLALQTRYG